MKSAWFWAGWLGVLWCAPGLGGEGHPAGVSCAEPVHDFGRARGGAHVTHEFILTNTGAVPVEIAGVKSSCGCLEIGEWTRKLEAGVSGTVPVVFDTVNYAGHVSERLTVGLAEAALPAITLQIEATVWWPIEVTPRAARFEFGANSGTNAHAVVHW